MKQLTDTVEGPLCRGGGKLKRTEVLERLGVGDFARVAQLSAEEAFRLVQRRLSDESQHLWARFDSELTKHAAEIDLRHRSEIQSLTFADLDRIEGELKKATKAISSASGLVTKYRTRLQELCESAAGRKTPTACELSKARIG